MANFIFCCNVKYISKDAEFFFCRDKLSVVVAPLTSGKINICNKLRANVEFKPCLYHCSQ